MSQIRSSRYNGTREMAAAARRVDMLTTKKAYAFGQRDDRALLTADPTHPQLW